MSIINIFEKALKEFRALADTDDSVNRNDPIMWSIYVATACGGISEVGLYTILGGCLRKRLETDCRDARLLINSRFIGDEIRPDFQIHYRGEPDKPLFACEFKLISDTGKSCASYSQMIIKIKEDLQKLKKMTQKSNNLETAAVIFFLRDGNNNTAIIEKEIKSLDFKQAGSPVKLWNPLGVNCGTTLQIYLAKNIRVALEDLEQGG